MIMNSIVSGVDLLGRRDEVALVLPILIVDNDDNPPFPKRLQRVIDFRELIVHGRSPNNWSADAIRGKRLHHSAASDAPIVPEPARP